MFYNSSHTSQSPCGKTVKLQRRKQILQVNDIDWPLSRSLQRAKNCSYFKSCLERDGAEYKKTRVRKKGLFLLPLQCDHWVFFFPFCFNNFHVVEFFKCNCIASDSYSRLSLILCFHFPYLTSLVLSLYPHGLCCLTEFLFLPTLCPSNILQIIITTPSFVA